MEKSNKYRTQLKKMGKELFPIFAGIFFGYNLALIAGDSILEIKEYNLQNSPSVSFLLGALCVCIFLFFMRNYKKRREILMISASASLITSAICAIALQINPEVDSLLLLIRFIMGITTGLSCIAPVYLVEEAPRLSLRGNYFGWYQLSITIGIFLAYLTMMFIHIFNLKFLYHSATLFVCFIMSGIYLVALYTTDSPHFDKWSEKHNKFKEKIDDIKKDQRYIDNKDRIDRMLIEPEGTQKEPWRKVFKLPLVIGVAIIVIQQLVGINIVIFKIPELLPFFCVNEFGILFFLLIIGLINILSTIPGMLMIDRIGRRSLFLIGMSGIILSLLFLTPLVANMKPDYNVIPQKFCLKSNGIPLKFKEKIDHSNKVIWSLVDVNCDQKNTGESFDRKDFYEKILPFNDEVYVINKSNVGKSEKSMKYDTIRYIIKDRVLYRSMNGDMSYPVIKPVLNSNYHVGLIIFVSLIVLYIISFASTLGIIGWLVPAEIFPIKIRNQGMAIVGGVHWFINILIVCVFKVSIVSSFFLFFCIFSFLAFFFGFFYFPETDGKRLKQIDYFWRNGGNLDEFNNNKIFIQKSKEAENKIGEYMQKIDKFDYEEYKKKE